MTLIMSVMLFVSNPTDNSVRLYQGLWNTGQLFLFALLIWLLITQSSLKQYSWVKMLLLSLLFSLLLGGLIEVLQCFVGGYMEWQDLFTDMLGGVLVFLAVQFSMPVNRKPTRSLPLHEPKAIKIVHLDNIHLSK